MGSSRAWEFVIRQLVGAIEYAMAYHKSVCRRTLPNHLVSPPDVIKFDEGERVRENKLRACNITLSCLTRAALR